MKINCSAFIPQSFTIEVEPTDFDKHISWEELTQELQTRARQAAAGMLTAGADLRPARQFFNAVRQQKNIPDGNDEDL